MPMIFPEFWRSSTSQESIKLERRSNIEDNCEAIHSHIASLFVP
jgi:hypothetical protein